MGTGRETKLARGQGWGQGGLQLRSPRTPSPGHAAKGSRRLKPQDEEVLGESGRVFPSQGPGRGRSQKTQGGAIGRTDRSASEFRGGLHYSPAF